MKPKPSNPISSRNRRAILAETLAMAGENESSGLLKAQRRREARKMRALAEKEPAPR